MRSAGFALRLPYAGFVARFRSLLPHASNGDAPKQQCVAILVRALLSGVLLFELCAPAAETSGRRVCSRAQRHQRRQAVSLGQEQSVCAPTDSRIARYAWRLLCLSDRSALFDSPDNVIQKKLEKLAICLSSAARGLLTRAAFVPKLAALREVKRQQRIGRCAALRRH